MPSPKVIKKAGFGIFTDRCMLEDTLVTAVRGGEAGGVLPMVRGEAEVPEGECGSWHIKVIEKASVKGNIYIGIETLDSAGKEATLLGKDWYDEKATNRAFYYRCCPLSCYMRRDDLACANASPTDLRLLLET